MKKAQDCQSMDEVRREIDRVDGAIVELLAERWTYVDRMWEFKSRHGHEANVPWRNREVIDRTRARAAALGLPAEMAEARWRQIIGWGVQHQEEKRRDGQAR
jgi:isochorismate pyruvate lyase